MTLCRRLLALVVAAFSLCGCAPKISVGEDRCGAERPAKNGVISRLEGDETSFFYPDDIQHEGQIGGGKVTARGDVHDYYGWGLATDCLDVADWDGLSFRAVGSLGTEKQAQFEVQLRTYSNVPSVDSNGSGACTLDGEGGAWDCCRNNSFVAQGVTEHVAVVYRIPWSDFSGGNPEPILDPTELVGIQLQFNCEVGMGACDVDLEIDNLQFYKGEANLGPRDEGPAMVKRQGCDAEDPASTPAPAASSASDAGL